MRTRVVCLVWALWPCWLCMRCNHLHPQHGHCEHHSCSTSSGTTVMLAPLPGSWVWVAWVTGAQVPSSLVASAAGSQL